MENAPFAIILVPTRELVVQIEVKEKLLLFFFFFFYITKIFSSEHVERIYSIKYSNTKFNWHKHR